MSPIVRFNRLRPWAVLPIEHQVERAGAGHRAKVYRGSFRFVRAERRPELCAPWAMGQELGWRIASPIDVRFTPLEQIEVNADDAEAAGAATGCSELWKRERSYLAVNRTSWLHLYQYDTGQGWENMFVPNGAGTVEWRLGWSVEVPRGYFLLLLASDSPGAPEVPTGVLSSTAVNRMNATGGLSLAVRTTDLTISRGQEVARMILLHTDSLQCTTQYADDESTDD